MLLLVGFDGVDWIQFPLGKMFKEFVEIEIPFTDGEMFVHLSVIVVEMDLTQVVSKGLKPEGKGSLAEGMMVPCIEAEPEVG